MERLILHSSLWLIVLLFSLAKPAKAEVVELYQNGDNWVIVTNCLGKGFGFIYDSLTYNPSCQAESYSENGRTFTFNYVTATSGYILASVTRDDGRIISGKILARPSQCEPPKVIVGGSCQAPRCEAYKGTTGDVGWHSRIYGRSPKNFWCKGTPEGGCASKLVPGSAFCGSVTSGYDCIATYEVTGPECPISDEADDNWCSDAECSKVEDKPEQDPNPAPETPTHAPSDPTAPISNASNPANVSVEQGDPLDVEELPEVTTPELTPNSNGDTVESVVNMNSDINKALINLNKDLNQTQANTNNELMLLNANVRQNSQQIADLHQANVDIYRNTKSLMQNMNSDITTAVNRNTDAIESGFASTNEKLDGLGQSMDKVSSSMESMADTIEELKEVDTSDATISGTCIETDTCTSFYQSSYPNGLTGILTEQMETLKSQVLDGFIGGFTSLDLSNASKPSFSLSVLDFGTFDFEEYIDFGWLFAFVRFCMTFSAILLARRLIFGG